MSCVVNLPRDISNCICGEWLDIVALLNLDTALCQKKCRIEFIQILSADIFCLQSFDSSCYTVDGLNWIYKRGIRLKDLYLTSHMYNGTDELACSINFSFVESLVLGDFQTELVINAVNSCHNLTSLTYYRCESNLNLFCNVNSIIVKNLKTIDITFLHKMEETLELLQCIEQHCRHLKKLILKGRTRWHSPVFDNEVMNTIVLHNPNLELVQIVSNISILNTIAVNCKNMNEISIIASNEIRLIDVARHLMENSIIFICSAAAEVDVCFRYSTFDAIKRVELTNYRLYDTNSLSPFLHNTVELVAMFNSDMNAFIDTILQYSVHTLETVRIATSSEYMSLETLKKVLQCKQLNYFYYENLDISGEAFSELLDNEWDYSVLKELKLEFQSTCLSTVKCMLEKLPTLSSLSILNVVENKQSIEEFIGWLKSNPGKVTVSITFETQATLLYKNEIISGTVESVV